MSPRNQVSMQPWLCFARDASCGLFKGLTWGARRGGRLILFLQQSSVEWCSSLWMHVVQDVDPSFQRTARPPTPVPCMKAHACSRTWPWSRRLQFA